jgi:O-antigen ligase
VPVVATFFVLSLASALLVGGAQGLTGLKIGFFYLLVAIAAWRCPLDAKERDRLVTILMGMGVITATVGLVQQVVGAQRLVDLGYQYNRDIRFSGSFLRSISTFNQSFPFALFLMLALLVGLACALENPRRLRNRLFLGSVPLLLVALAFTVTRAGWIGLVVGCIYLGIRSYRVLLVSAVRAVAVAAVVLLLLSGFSAALFATSSGLERVDRWRANVGQIESHPLGIGIGTTGSAGEKANLITGNRSKALQPDNFYFKTTLELGVLGLWIFVLILIAAFTSAQSAADILTGRDAALASGVAAMVLAAGAVSIVSTYFEIFPMELYFWLFLTVVATCVRESS